MFFHSYEYYKELEGNAPTSCRKMPIFTANHCLACYKECDPLKLVESGEICKRFFILACRYLSLTCDHLDLDKT